MGKLKFSSISWNFCVTLREEVVLFCHLEIEGNIGTRFLLLSVDDGVGHGLGANGRCSESTMHVPERVGPSSRAQRMGPASPLSRWQS